MGHSNSLCFQRVQPDIFSIDRIFVRRCETEKSVTVADETVSDPDIQTGLGRVRPFTAFWTDSLHCTTISHCVRRECDCVDGTLGLEEGSYYEGTLDYDGFKAKIERKLHYKVGQARRGRPKKA